MTNELLKEIENDYWAGKANPIDITEVFDLAIKALEQKRPKGEWLHPYKSNVACECSVCNRQMPITNDFKYCPKCGADMRGDTE